MGTTSRLPTLDHGNNFDGLRLIASLMVLISHQFALLGTREPTLAQGMTLGSIAVAMFFVMSGYLVTESWYQDPHITRFAMRRLLRIWPALMVATVVLVLASTAITSVPLHEFFGRETRRFITFNAQFRPVYTLPGVFVTAPANAVMSAVNGSWWTIPLEAKCYVYLVALGAIGLRRRAFSMLALLVVAFMYVRTLPGHTMDNAFDNLSYFYTAFFLTGVCARQFAGEIRRNYRLMLCAGAAFLLVAGLLRQPWLAEWAFIAPLTLLAGSRSTPGLRSAARYGDLSYGIYIYAYFAQQLTIHLWPAMPSYAATIGIACVVTIMLGWCSWHAVEAPALALKRRLREWFPDVAI